MQTAIARINAEMVLQNGFRRNRDEQYLNIRNYPAFKKKKKKKTAQITV